ncbi:MAG: acyl-CoA dehydrogenase family protein, partial [Sulfolobales archaeon]
MNYEEDIILESVKEFSKREIEPISEKIDREDWYPRELVRKMGELGYLVPLLNGLNHYQMVKIIAEIAKYSGSVALIQDAQGELVGEALRYVGNKALNDNYLFPLAEGKRIGGFGLSEPCCGSDAAAIRTMATQKGDSWIIKGKKMWTTQGTVADFYVVAARTGKLEDREKGISLFIVPRDKCVEVRKIEVMGCRGTGTAEVGFNDCEIPKDHLLGEVNKGWKIIKHVLNVGRIAISAIAYGLAVSSFAEALEWAKSRESFGNKLIEFQGIRWYLARLYTNLDIMNTYLKEISILYDKYGDSITHKISMLK